MKLTQNELIVLETAVLNYESFWREWIVSVNDGSCQSEYVNRNIKEFSQLVKRFKLEGKL